MGGSAGIAPGDSTGLAPDGVYLYLETNCSDKLEENFGLAGSLFYGVSIMYCLTTSLAAGGEGLGTLGLPESRLRDLCSEVGFSSVRRLPLNDPFNSLYQVELQSPDNAEPATEATMGVGGI